MALNELATLVQGLVPNTIFVGDQCPGVVRETLGVIRLTDCGLVENLSPNGAWHGEGSSSNTDPPSTYISTNSMKTDDYKPTRPGFVEAYDSTCQQTCLAPKGQTPEPIVLAAHAVVTVANQRVSLRVSPSITAAWLFSI